MRLFLCIYIKREKRERERERESERAKERRDIWRE